jgi:hypothetical protein
MSKSKLFLLFSIFCFSTTFFLSAPPPVPEAAPEKIDEIFSEVIKTIDEAEKPKDLYKFIRRNYIARKKKLRAKGKRNELAEAKEILLGLMRKIYVKKIKASDPSKPAIVIFGPNKLTRNDSRPEVLVDENLRKKWGEEWKTEEKKIEEWVEKKSPYREPRKEPETEPWAEEEQEEIVEEEEEEEEKKGLTREERREALLKKIRERRRPPKKKDEPEIEPEEEEEKEVKWISDTFELFVEDAMEGVKVNFSKGGEIIYIGLPLPIAYEGKRGIYDSKIKIVAPFFKETLYKRELEKLRLLITLSHILAKTLDDGREHTFISFFDFSDFAKGVLGKIGRKNNKLWCVFPNEFVSKNEKKIFKKFFKNQNRFKGRFFHVVGEDDELFFKKQKKFLKRNRPKEIGLDFVCVKTKRKNYFSIFERNGTTCYAFESTKKTIDELASKRSFVYDKGVERTFYTISVKNMKTINPTHIFEKGKDNFKGYFFIPKNMLLFEKMRKDFALKTELPQSVINTRKKYKEELEKINKYEELKKKLSQEGIDPGDATAIREKLENLKTELGREAIDPDQPDQRKALEEKLRDLEEWIEKEPKKEKYSDYEVLKAATKEEVPDVRRITKGEEEGYAVKEPVLIKLFPEYFFKKVDKKNYLVDSEDLKGFRPDFVFHKFEDGGETFYVANTDRPRYEYSFFEGEKVEEQWYDPVFNLLKYVDPGMHRY